MTKVEIFCVNFILRQDVKVPQCGYRENICMVGGGAFVSGCTPSSATRLWRTQDDKNGLLFDAVANFGRTNF